MTAVYSSGFEPNPLDTIDVLAFVFCSPQVFVPGGDESEMQAVAELIQPAKEAAIRRWHEARVSRMIL